MPNEQDGRVKFGRSYVYLDPDSLQSTPDAATPGVWRVKAGVDSSGNPNIGVVNSVNTRIGDVVLTSTDVGLANVNNTSDANKPVSTAQQTALNAKIDTTTANASFLGITAKAADSELLDGLNSTSYVQTTTQFGGDVSGTYNNIVIADDSHNHIIANVDGLQTTLNAKADLVGGVVPTNQLPAIAITEYLGSVSSQAALLALSGQKGDWAIRSDTSTTWIITGTTPSDIGSWTELEYPAAPVSSVNGATGTVVLGHSDVGAASAAQGTTADSAVQPGDNISQLNNDSGFISATLSNEEVQDIVGGMVNGNTETGITVTYQDSDGTIDFAVATQTDNNFTTTLKNKLDGIEDSATADQTASEIFAAVLTVDGVNSGLDSDLLDGQHGAYYLDYTNFTNTPTFSNADSLDNLDSTQFIRSDAADVKTSGTLNFSDDVKLTLGTSNDLEIYHNGSNSYIDNSTGSLYLRGANGNYVRVQAKSGEESIVAASDGSVELYYDNVKKIETTNAGASVTGTLTATAFSGAGGSLTGVNSSQLNSQNASYYLDYSNFTNTPTIPTNNNQLTNGAGYITSADGGNAATVDGLDSTDFLRSNANDSYSGTLNINGMEFIAGNVARNLKLKGTGGSSTDVGLSLFDSSDNWRIQIYGANNSYGFLDSNYGGWDIHKNPNGQLSIDVDGTGLSQVWCAGNDGSGSGLDADTLDGLNSSSSATANTVAVRDGSSDVSLRTVKPTFADQTTISGAFGYRINNSTDNSLRFCSDMSAVRAHMGANNASNLTTGTIPIARISGGAGTGLDADLLDGVQGSNYLRSDSADTFSGDLTGSSGTNITLNSSIGSNDSTAYASMSGYLGFTNDYSDSARGPNKIRLQNDGSWLSGFGISANTLDIYSGGNIKFWKSNSTTSFTSLMTLSNTGELATTAQGVVWGAGNDGASSGLDADTLDGQQGSYYLDYNNLTNLPGGVGNTSIGTGNSKAEIIDTGTDGRFIVTTEGSERLRIDSSGRLLVGTSTAGSGQLTVASTSHTGITIRSGSTSTNSNLIFADAASGADVGVIQYKHSDDSLRITVNNGERLRIDSSGNVGIGTSSPQRALVVSDAGTEGFEFFPGSSSGGNTLNHYNRATSAFVNITTNADQHIFGRADGEKMRIDSSGNVGIGYTSPSAKLDVNGHIRLQNNGRIGVGGSTTPETSVRFTNTDCISFIVNNGEKARIDSSGSVNIGGNYTQSTFKVQINTGTNKFISFGNASHDYLSDEGSGIIFSRPSDGAKQLSGIFQHSNQSFGIATRGDLTLHAGGSGSYSNSPERLRIDSSGRLLVGTSTSIFGSSNIQCGNTGGNNFTGIRYSTGVGGAQLILGHSQSGTIGSNVALSNNDYIGQVEFRGADGTNYLVGAGIDAFVDGTPGTNDMPGRLVFSTTADGASSPTERMRIDSSGVVTIGGNTAWHAGNDGSGSGLDADTLDGVQGANYFNVEGKTKRWTVNLGNITYPTYYKVASVNQGSGGIHIKGSLNNHVESFGTSYFDLNIFGREDNNGANIVVSGTFGVSSPGTGLLVVKATDSTYDRYDVYVIVTKYTQASVDITKEGHATIDLSYGSTTTKPTGLATEFDSGTTSQGLYVVNDSSYYKMWHAGNDGSGSGLDADLLDGVQGSNYLRSDQNDTLSGNLTVNRLFLGGSSNGGFDYNSTADTLEILTTNGSTHSEFNSTSFVPNSNNTKNLGSNAKRWATLYAQDVKIDGNSAWHAGNDGSGSGLDADTVDGKHSTDLLHYRGIVAGDWDTIFTTGSGKTNTSGLYQVQNITNGSHSNYPTGVYNYGGVFAWQLANHTFKLYASHTGDLVFQTGWNNDEYSGWRKIWNTGNDGSGSGLDADTLDGLQASSFLRSDANDSTSGDLTISGNLYLADQVRIGDDAWIEDFNVANSIRIKGNQNSNQGYISFGNRAEKLGCNNSSTLQYNGNTVWHAGNDGSGSGLDADTLDGVQGANFLRSDAADTKTSGHLTFNDNIQAQFGSSADLKIYHDGSNSYLTETGTGNLILQTSRFEVTNAGGTEYIINAYENGKVCLYYDSSQKLETTSSGVSISGSLTATGNVTAYSDITLKTDIEVIPNALEKVQQLRGITYNRIDLDDGVRYAGVIAQEVEQVLPEVVKTGEDGIKSVAYGNIVSLLIEAMKEQQVQIDELKTLVNQK